MSKFQRGLRNQAFIDALNKLRKDPESYWSKMVQDRSLFIAIRDGYISVYYKGNSLCELSYWNGIVAKVHYKYLLDPSVEQRKCYVKAVEGRFSKDILDDKLIKNLADIHLIKKASDVHAGREKTGLHSIVTGEKNVLDLEVAFPGANDSSSKDDDSSRKMDRIDYLKLEQEVAGSDIRLVFYEAKHFTNPDVKSQGTPKVLKQLAAYEHALKRYKSEIWKSYFEVFKNLKELGLIGSRKLIEDASTDKVKFSVDVKPRLLIFDYDKDQKNGKMWNLHRAKLSKVLGERLITRGQPYSRPQAVKGDEDAVQFSTSVDEVAP